MASAPRVTLRATGLEKRVKCGWSSQIDTWCELLLTLQHSANLYAATNQVNAPACFFVVSKAWSSSVPIGNEVEATAIASAVFLASSPQRVSELRLQRIRPRSCRSSTGRCLNFIILEELRHSFSFLWPQFPCTGLVPEPNLANAWSACVWSSSTTISLGRRANRQVGPHGCSTISNLQRCLYSQHLSEARKLHGAGCFIS